MQHPGNRRSPGNPFRGDMAFTPFDIGQRMDSPRFEIAPTSPFAIEYCWFRAGGFRNRTGNLQGVNQTGIQTVQVQNRV